MEDLFEIIHSDVWGHYTVPSSCGAHYFLTIVNDASRGVWVYLKENSEVETSIKRFVAMAKIQFNKQVKVVRTSNGFEFRSGSMKVIYAKNCTTHQTSCVDTPQQNGRIKGKH